MQKLSPVLPNLKEPAFQLMGAGGIVRRRHFTIGVGGDRKLPSGSLSGEKDAGQRLYIRPDSRGTSVWHFGAIMDL